MKDMQKAVDRIQAAIQKNEHILVYGDYEVDGTTSVALLFSLLTETYPHVATYIPDRYQEGYGVFFAGIEYAHRQNYGMKNAFDSRIKAIEEVANAKEKGIDFVICDHDIPNTDVPNAVGVLDPKQEDCLYPYKELCGCGDGFKLSQA